MTTPASYESKVTTDALTLATSTYNYLKEVNLMLYDVLEMSSVDQSAVKLVSFQDLYTLMDRSQSLISICSQLINKVSSLP